MIYHKAGCILDGNFSIATDYAIGVKDNIISHIVKSKDIDSGCEVIDHGSGIIVPGFVNCHTHLELSFLKNTLDYSGGFQSWVLQLITKRKNTPLSIIKETAKLELEKIYESGTSLIGDISSTGALRDIFLDSDISGYFFYEELGNKPQFGDVELKSKISFAAHAPHTSSPELIKKTKEITSEKNLPFSIHCMESSDEIDFIRGKNKNWEKFLESRDIFFKSWPLPAATGVQYLDKIGILDNKTMLVHLLYLESEDLDIIEKKGVNICICPRSNKNLHGRLPEIKKILEKNINVAIGTDSLASCDSIDIFDEMKFIYNKYPWLDPADILRMATINGATALGLESFAGSISEGKKAEIFYIDTEDVNIFDSIIFCESGSRRRII
ncbi:MAG: hypothetical protein CSA18_03250 [Deltaproteobacteria bacterium]|nr:MAG: hypothetical protein CSA18_03250 [Deltaproteobacteria bacterium]